LEEKTISITKSRSNYGVKEYKTWQEKNKVKQGINYAESKYVIITWNGTPMGTFRVRKVISTIADKNRKKASFR